MGQLEGGYVAKSQKTWLKLVGFLLRTADHNKLREKCEIFWKSAKNAKFHNKSQEKVRNCAEKRERKCENSRKILSKSEKVL